MGFRSIRFHGFRNLENNEINLEAQKVYLIGENGQGKTNVLEALYLLGYGSSFRTRQDREMIKFDESIMGIHGKFNMPGEPETPLSVTWVDGNKEIRVHGKIISDRKELLRRTAIVVFSHGDILFSTGPHERRRWFMDQTLSIDTPLFVDQLRRYRRLLKERNYLLKTRKTNLLEQYSEQLAFAGLAILERREALTKELTALFCPLFHEISGLEEAVNIIYRPSWAEAQTVDAVMVLFREKLENDLNLGTTGTGPHRDKFFFLAGNRDFAKTASTGQHRLLSLVLRVAQAQFFSLTTGNHPILLLDDVLLELDPRKRRLFREKLPEAEQIFYTFLPGEETEKKDERALTYELKKGVFYGR